MRVQLAIASLLLIAAGCTVEVGKNQVTGGQSATATDSATSTTGLTSASGTGSTTSASGSGTSTTTSATTATTSVGSTTTASTTDGSSGGSVCGDGVADPGETCDTNDFGGQDCGSFGFDAGDLICSNSCSIETSGCSGCGNNVKEGAEVCDGQDVGGEDCESQGFGAGNLACESNCMAFDTTPCPPAPVCGDGMKNGTEDCDTADLDGKTCVTEGFDEGTLSCAGNCEFDTSLCVDVCALEGEPCFDVDDCCNTGCKKGGAVCIVNNQQVCCT